MIAQDRRRVGSSWRLASRSNEPVAEPDACACDEHPNNPPSGVARQAGNNSETPRVAQQIGVHPTTKFATAADVVGQPPRPDVPHCAPQRERARLIEPGRGPARLTQTTAAARCVRRLPQPRSERRHPHGSRDRPGWSEQPGAARHTEKPQQPRWKRSEFSFLRLSG